MRSRIHTAMVGRIVKIMTKQEMERLWPGGHGRFRHDLAGQTGVIANVYLTADGPCYDVLMPDGQIWVDCWSGFFRVETVGA